MAGIVGIMSSSELVTMLEEQEGVASNEAGAGLDVGGDDPTLLSLQASSSASSRLGGVHLLGLLLGLHAPVLEPDLDLALGKGDGVCDLDPAPPGQVAVGAELLLELQSLEPGVRLASPLRSVARVD